MTVRQFVAICPECDDTNELEHEPKGKWWPHCKECGQSMNVYVRGIPHRQGQSQGAPQSATRNTYLSNGNE